MRYREKSNWAGFDLGGVHGFKALETEGFDILADELAAIDDGFFSRSKVTSPIKLRATGMEAAESPSSVIQGLTIPPGLRDRVQGCLIPEDSILVLDGDICLENVNVDARAALVAHAAPSASVTIKEAPSPPSPPLRFRNSATPISPNAPEYLRIRGYFIADQGAKKQIIFHLGRWIITPQGEVHSALNESNGMLASSTICVYF